jgi:hypothetical protein
MDSPSNIGTRLLTPALSNPSDEELATELNQLPEAASTSIKMIRKLLKEKHPRWALSELRVRQAWNAMIDKKTPADKDAASSETSSPPLPFASLSDFPSISLTTLSSHGILQAVQASAEFLPHFAKKQVATMAFFGGPSGDIRHHAGEREEKYRALYDDMKANTQLWMHFLDERSNYNHAENICGILVRLRSIEHSKRCLTRAECFPRQSFWDDPTLNTP